MATVTGSDTEAADYNPDDPIIVVPPDLPGGGNVVGIPMIPPQPLNNITPFTYRDGITYLQVLETLRKVINELIQNNADLNGKFDDTINYLNATIQDLMSKLIGYTIEVNEDYYTASMMDGSSFTAYTNHGVDKLIAPLKDQSSGRVNVKSFGGTGDGVTDDTQALQDFLDYLSANGGDGFMGPGTYRVTAPLNVIAPDRSFTLTGAGTGETIIKTEITSGNGLNLNNLESSILSNFSIHGTTVPPNVASGMSHGIAAPNCRDVTIQDVDIQQWNGTAVMFYKNVNFTGESLRNHMNRVSATGSGVENNGLMHENSTGSSMTNCTVTNLSLTGSPSYAMQMKNGCQACTITGGTIDGAKAGIIFGYEIATESVGCIITGVTVKNCVLGVAGSWFRGCRIDAIVDMANNPQATHGVNLTGNSNYNTINVSVLNIPEGATAVRIQEDYNQVNITSMNTINASNVLLDFAASSTGNIANVGIIAGQSPNGVTQQGQVNDAGTNNVINYEQISNLYTTNPAGSSVQRFVSPGNSTTFMSYSHNTDTFMLRARGTDVLAANDDAIAPGVDNVATIGSSGKRFLEAYVSNGMIVNAQGGIGRHRITVDSSGQVVAIPIA